MTRFPARTVLVVRATFHAQSGFRIARARSVALQGRFRASDQRISVEPGHATALNPVIDDFTLGARATGGRAITGSCEKRRVLGL